MVVREDWVGTSCTRCRFRESVWIPAWMLPHCADSNGLPCRAQYLAASAAAIVRPRPGLSRLHLERTASSASGPPDLAQSPLRHHRPPRAAAQAARQHVPVARQKPGRARGFGAGSPLGWSWCTSLRWPPCHPWFWAHHVECAAMLRSMLAQPDASQWADTGHAVRAGWCHQLAARACHADLCSSRACPTLVSSS